MQAPGFLSPFLLINPALACPDNIESPPVRNLQSRQSLIYKFNSGLKLLLLIFIITVGFNTVLFSQTKRIYAVRTSVPPLIDGVLNDSVWNKAKPISDFYDREPVPGALPSEKTEVKILYDDKNLYVGVMCYDDEPGKIIARELKLDGKWSGDDNIALWFDTFHDRRHSYWFGTNPLGMRDDALLTSGKNFSGFNESWNGVWFVKSAIVNNGWSAEMVFPFSTFKFFNEKIQVWGVNFMRTIQRKGETVQWTSYEKDQDFFNMTFGGELLGIRDIKRGNPVYFKPFYTVGGEKTDSSRIFVSKPGLDIKYGVTETLSLDLTVNTDFAQVESDQEKINLTRFPLFYPEKRDFFIEGANTLSLPLGGNDNIYYSRRIGLSNGEAVPIIAGAKLVGRLNNTEIGFLNVQTAAKNGEPPTNYSVGRVKFDLFNQSYAGIFFSNKTSSYDYSQSFAGDVVLRTNNFLENKSLIFGATLAKTNERKQSGRSWAGNFYLDYPNDLIEQHMDYKFIQENFNPEIGFVSRTGINHYEYSFAFTPRVNLGDIKKLEFSPVDLACDFDKNSTLLTGEISFQPLGFSTVQGDNVSLQINRYFDKLNEDFNIFGSSVIPAGDYWFTTYGLDYRSAPGRTFYGEANLQAGNYYTGSIKSATVNVTWSAGSHFSIYTDYTHNNIRLVQSNFSTNELGARLSYDFSTMVFSSVFAQWNNELNEININYRFNWQPNVGSNFYLVVNHLLSTGGALRTKDITVLTKIVWQIIL